MGYGASLHCSSSRCEKAYYRVYPCAVFLHRRAFCGGVLRKAKGPAGGAVDTCYSFHTGK